MEILIIFLRGKQKQKRTATKISSRKKANWPNMGLHFISGPNRLNRDIAYYYWLDLNEMSIPEVMKVDILWESGVTMKF